MLEPPTALRLFVLIAVLVNNFLDLRFDIFLRRIFGAPGWVFLVFPPWGCQLDHLQQVISWSVCARQGFFFRRLVRR